MNWYNANGVIVDLNSILNTGNGNDTVISTATATDKGVGGAGSSVIADGIENRGRVLTGIGNDVIVGTGEAHAHEARAVAGGIDNGLGSSISGTPVSPVLNTADNEDFVKGSAIASAVGDVAIADGIENAGTIRTEAGNDVIEAEAFSDVIAGDAATDRSIADGIDNRGLVTTGDGSDRIEADATAIADGVAFATANGIDNIATINLGAGIDVLDAFAKARSVDGDAEAIGILQNSDINLGIGNDILIAKAQAASVKGNAEAFGINGGTIKAGAGNDAVIASASAFSASGTVEFAGLENYVDIHLQAGNDLLQAFGNADADGGAGFDTLEVNFSKFEVDNTLGASFINHGGGAGSITFAEDGVNFKTLNFENFEKVSFADITITLNETSSF